jgi:hypothetical protein
MKLPPDLHEAALAQAYHRGYPSFTAYMVALLRLDSINPGANDHKLAKQIAERPADKRAAIDRAIMKEVCEPTWAAASERRAA